MAVQPSPYARAAGRLRDMGFHSMPVAPNTKFPGALASGRWHAMPRWQEWCARQPPEFLHERWEEWADAGVCIGHGRVVGLDVDTDRTDVTAAVLAAVPPSPVRRFGSKGWMGYYRPRNGLADQAARLRWFDGDGVICVELLLHGTQSVLPPTIHPGTGQPYRWLTLDTLESTSLGDLPELPGDALAQLDAALGRLGLNRDKPQRDRGAAAPAAQHDHDLEKDRFRSVNDRALAPAALGRWWLTLGLPKARQRGGSWEAVPSWRTSSRGRPLEERNPNLRATPGGIRDWGTGEGLTAIDVVMRARDCSVLAAAEWLEPFLAPEPQAEIDLDAIAAAAERRRAAASADPAENLRDAIPRSSIDLSRWCVAPAFGAPRQRTGLRPAELPSDAAFEALVPRAPQSFPLGPDDCPGALGEVAGYIDEASATATEAGALAVALPVLGAVMGRAFATPSNLRTNILSVALGGSGSGKTSLVNPAKELLRLAGVPEVIGQDRIASGSGLLRMLTVEPRRVCFLDEFGHLLQQIGAPGAGIHSRQILTEFTRLYSDAGTLYTGTAYAGREPEPIDCPHLCLFGMATPEQFWRAFGSSSLEDGSIARFLVFPIGTARIKDPDLRFQPQAVAAVKKVVEAIRGRVRGNLGRPELCTVGLDEQADAARLALQETMQSCAQYAELSGVRGAPAILRRVAENAQRIALISAVGRNPHAPVIEMRDFDIGHALARWSATTMIHNIASHIADNQTERDVNDVERFIHAAGGRGRTWREVQRSFRRVKARDLRDIFEGLEREGSIRVEADTPPGGRWPVKTAFPAT